MISDMLALIFLIGGLQGVMLTVALTRIPNAPPALIYLIILIGLVSFDLLGQLIYWQSLYREWPHLLGVFSFLPASYGPLFYLYVRTLIRPGSQWKQRNLWMFTPFVTCYLVNLPILLASAEDKIAMVDNIPVNGMPVTLIIGSVIQLSSFFFVLASLVNLWTNRHIGIRSQWLDWVMIMAIFQVIIWCLVIINLVFPFRVLINGAPYLMVSLMLYVLGYKALFASRGKPEVLDFGNSTDDVDWQASFESNSGDSDKYGNQRLDTNTMAQLWLELEGLLITDRLYTQPNLKIADLAVRSGFAVHLVSQVINSTQQRNFNDVVNSMRLKEACRLLSLQPRLPIQTIMEMAGFQAKSTFNTLFKQATGQTPSQYRKSN